MFTKILQTKPKKISKKWVTLLELMLSIAIFSMIMIIVMSSVQSMMAGRIKAMNRIALTDELYFFAEQLFTEIKNGGTLDYEEYWNRKMVGTWSANWAYNIFSGLGNYGGNIRNEDVNSSSTNFWDLFYYCRSTPSEKMDGNGCSSENFNNLNTNQTHQSQRYGQYALQFWDYNANRDDDNNNLGDEDGDGNIIGDEDDRNLYRWPKVFEDQANNPIRELYLFNDHNKQNPMRTLFRWKIIPDPNRPSNITTNCLTSTPEPNFTAEDGCIGTLQVLKLRWYDLGMNHTANTNTPDATRYDGKVDTWVCEKWWNCRGPEIQGMEGLGKIATGKDEEWINLFPNSITVRKFRLEAYPERDPWLAVAEPDCWETEDAGNSCISPFIHPYVRISLEIGFSHGKRRALRGENPTISLQTTINLNDFR